MAECLKEITLQALWQYEITEQEEEECINDQVVPLNHMVRESYLKYLKQVLTKNLNMCSDSNNIHALHDIEKCAGVLELRALRLCMVTSLYQKAMLQMVTDIKRHSKATKIYPKFEEILSQNCLCRISKCKATQTELLEIKKEDYGNVLERIKHVNIKTEISDENEPDHIPSQLTFPLSSNMDFNESCASQDFISIPSRLSLLETANERKELEKGDTCANVSECHADESDVCNDNSQNIVHNKQDTILSDCLTEPGNTMDKTNHDVNSSTVKSSPFHDSSFQTNAEDEDAIKQLKWILNGDASKEEFGEASLYETATQELIRILESEGELSEEDISERKQIEETVPQTSIEVSTNSYWKTEKHFQKNKLHESISKMCCDPEAKVKMKNTFFDMFGFDSDEDDVWCSKEKVAQYKQRIAPLVVKHLLPYYKQKRILSRHVFKRVASHITDKLVCFKHSPEEADVEKGIVLFFSYHGFIGKPQDIWSGWGKELH